MTDITLSHSQGMSLTQWLSYLESIHNVEIDLGLTRINKVAERLKLDFDGQRFSTLNDAFSFAKIITVAGTNGKGTTCAFLENALLSENKTVAVYSSPHIEHFNERLRFNKNDMADHHFIQAFEKIETARAEISLSYYEFTTLASFLILLEIRPEFIILEVGLGGRLDATNIIDPSIAVITTVDLDHQAFLGDTREKIGFEKAGIMRHQGIAVVGDSHPPVSLLEHATQLETDIYIRAQDFYLHDDINGHWQWKFKNQELAKLTSPHIPKDNVATALTVLSLLSIDISRDKVNQWIALTRVPGRQERFKQQCHIMLDVGHNPQAARYLAGELKKQPFPRVHAVVGMLIDKDIKNTIAPMLAVVDYWYIGDLGVPRGARAKQVAEVLSESSSSICFDNVTDAFRIALENANDVDLVLVFGSFITVAEIRRLLV
jgi:dihydrofolate synthase/folylpolyglutamate synthase